MKFKDKQECFDFVVSKLIEQGQPAKMNGSCKYRAPMAPLLKPLACAGGQVVDDEEYEFFWTTYEDGPSRGHRRNSLEGETIHSAINIFGERAPEAWRQFPQLMEDLQLAHDKDPRDECSWLENFVALAKDVAKEHSLSFAKHEEK